MHLVYSTACQTVDVILLAYIDDIFAFAMK